MKKVVRLTTLLDFGGQERKYLSFTQRPSLLKYEFFFAALGGGGYTEGELIRRGFPVKIFAAKYSLISIITIYKLYKWFKNIKPDLVHTAAVEANVHGIIAARLAGVKCIIAEEIGIPKHSKKTQLLMRFIYKGARDVICVSNAVKNHLFKIKEINKSKGTVIYNPVGENKVLAKQNNFPTIVCVGRLERVKNQQVLIRVLPKIKIPNLRLILVGDGRSRDYLEKLAKQQQVADRVKITGFVSNPSYFLSFADLFVLPSLSEGFGIAVLEAMQQGVPCLCSNVGGIPEYVVNGKNGWLFDPIDEELLISKIEEILSLPFEMRREVGLRGQEYVLNHFSEADYVEKLQNYYAAFL